VGHQFGSPRDDLRRGGHPTSDSARRLLAKGQLVILEVKVELRGWNRTVYLVTGPSDLELKILAFRQQLEHLFSGHHPDGSDFAYAFAPPHYWESVGDNFWAPHQDYWSALFDGIIWTFDNQVAAGLRRQYLEICRDFLPELYARAECAHKFYV
jgi:hypothetical protein